MTRAPARPSSRPASGPAHRAERSTTTSPAMDGAGGPARTRLDRIPWTAPASVAPRGARPGRGAAACVGCRRSPSTDRGRPSSPARFASSSPPRRCHAGLDGIPRAGRDGRGQLEQGRSQLPVGTACHGGRDPTVGRPQQAGGPTAADPAGPAESGGPRPARPSGPAGRPRAGGPAVPTCARCRRRCAGPRRRGPPAHPVPARRPVRSGTSSPTPPMPSTRRSEPRTPSATGGFLWSPWRARTSGRAPGYAGPGKPQPTATDPTRYHRPMVPLRLSGEEFAWVLAAGELHERVVDSGQFAVVVEGTACPRCWRPRRWRGLRTLAGVVVGVVGEAGTAAARPRRRRRGPTSWSDAGAAALGRGPPVGGATTRMASTTLAVLLRTGEGRSVPDGMVAESTAYGLLQGGPEFARWRAATPARDRPAVPGAGGPYLPGGRRAGHHPRPPPRAQRLQRPDARRAAGCPGGGRGRPDDHLGQPPGLGRVLLQRRRPGRVRDASRSGVGPSGALAAQRWAGPWPRWPTGPRPTSTGRRSARASNWPPSPAGWWPSPRRRISLPEVRLGLVPGAGGTVEPARRGSAGTPPCCWPSARQASTPARRWPGAWSTRSRGEPGPVPGRRPLPREGCRPEPGLSDQGANRYGWPRFRTTGCLLPTPWTPNHPPPTDETVTERTVRPGVPVVNIAILLDLMADSFGDRTALTDGGGVPLVRRPAPAGPPGRCRAEQRRRHHVGLRRHLLGRGAGRAVRGRLGRGLLCPAQLPVAGRRPPGPDRAAGRPHWPSPRRSWPPIWRASPSPGRPSGWPGWTAGPRTTGRVPGSPTIPSGPRSSCSRAARRAPRRPPSSPTTTSPPT